MIYVIVGSSGSGKTTIVDILLKETPVEKLVTCTTREIRPGDIPDISYHFLSKEEFKTQVASGDFVEHTIYANNMYGSRYREFDEAIKKGKDIIVIMDIFGAKFIKEKYPNDSMSIFILRDRKELIKTILARDVSDDVKLQRVIQLDEDEKAMGQCDVIVKNDNLQNAVAIIKKLMMYA